MRRFDILTNLLCCVACVAACLNAHLFHRDASIGNIMIGLDDEGRLNDWDLCRGVDVDESLEGPRTVSWRLEVSTLGINLLYREPGSSYPSSYSNSPDRSTH